MAEVLVTPLGRLSYVNFFSARYNKKRGEEVTWKDCPRYGCTFLILPPAKMITVDAKGTKDKDRLMAMLAAAQKVGREADPKRGGLGAEGFDRAVKAKKVNLFKAVADELDPSNYPSEFEYFIRPWTYGLGAAAAGPSGNPPVKIGAPPGILSEYKDKETGKPIPITDANKVFSGAWGRLSVTPFFTNVEGNPSISWQLHNVQICMPPDGYSADRLDNRVEVSDEFDATRELEAADLAAMSSVASAGGNDADELAKLLGG